MYAKIFSQIFDSTLAEDFEARHIFMDLLVMADQYGVVDMTGEALARRINVPLEKVMSAISKLCKPDPASRSKTSDGRRITLIDPERGWGWQIVNYEVYDGIRDENARREYMKGYMRLRRAKERDQKADVNICKPQLTELAPTPTPTPTPTTTTTTTDKEDSRRISKTLFDPRDIQLAWNALAKRHGLPYWQRMTKKRQTAINARSKEDGWLGDYLAALDHIPQCPFLMGQVKGRKWKATPDFFLRPDSVTKILEGAYDGDTHATRNYNKGF